MKRLIAILLALQMMLFAASAEIPEDEFGYAFDDEGYSGWWLPLEGLGLQFCLPEDWVQLEPELGFAFSAISADGKASLAVRLEAENVVKLSDWTDENLPGCDIEDAGLYSAAVLETEGQLTICFIDDSMRLIAFYFDRSSENVMPRDYALQIAGTTAEDWGEADEYFDESEDGGGVLSGSAGEVVPG